MLEAGVYGAKVQSFNTSNPRSMLKRMIQNNPGADKAALFAKFQIEIMKDENADYLKTVLEYWFSNNFKSLMEEAMPKKTAAPSTPAKPKISTKEKVAALVVKGTAQLAAKIEEEVEVKAKKKIASMIWNLTLPNGKRVGDGTCGEAVTHFADLRDLFSEFDANDPVVDHFEPA